MRMLRVAALTAASLGLVFTASVQAQQPSGKQGQLTCQQIWQRSDKQNHGYVTGQQAQRMHQAMQTAQAGTSGMGGGAAGGGVTDGTAGKMSGTKGKQRTAERVSRQDFMSACQSNPQAFQNLRG